MNKPPPANATRSNTIGFSATKTRLAALQEGVSFGLFSISLDSAEAPEVADGENMPTTATHSINARSWADIPEDWYL